MFGFETEVQLKGGAAFKGKNHNSFGCALLQVGGSIGGLLIPGIPSIVLTASGCLQGWPQTFKMSAAALGIMPAMWNAGMHALLALSLSPELQRKSTFSYLPSPSKGH